jgi:hypothetical protein
MEFETNEAIRKHLPVQVKVFQSGDPELEKVSFLYQTFLPTKQQLFLIFMSYCHKHNIAICDFVT